MTSDNSDLSPCPFCGGGETEIRTNYMPVRMSRKPEIIGVEINHWCDGLTRGAQRRSVHAHGRDRDDAIAAWNRRSAPFAPPAEVQRLRAERDTLLLDARDFLRWFNRHHPDPSSNPDHPWCVLNDRLNAYADTLATFDSGVETKEETKP